MRRERLERKLERRREWAEKAKARSAQRFGIAHQIADGIPMGQPILVGHHSERHARRDQERIHNNMGKGVELGRLAEHHDSKADGIERQLDHSVFSDDENAVEALEARAQSNEAKREQMKRVNVLYRKGDAAGLAALGLDLGQLRAKLQGAYSWEQQPYPSYSLTNLGARIRADRERIKQIQARQQRTAQAEAAGGVSIEQCADGYVRVTFAEKPERAILDALKAAGFWWGAGAWAGKAEALPACIQDSNRAGA